MYGTGMLKAFGVTLQNFLRKPATIQYPEERDSLSTQDLEVKSSHGMKNDARAALHVQNIAH